MGEFPHLCVLYYLNGHPLHDLANILQRKKNQKEKLNQNEQPLLNTKSFIQETFLAKHEQPLPNLSKDGKDGGVLFVTTPQREQAWDYRA